MKTISKRITNLEGNSGELKGMGKAAYQSGVITADEYYFFLKHAGLLIPPIAWLDEYDKQPIKRYRLIGQKIGFLPNCTWASEPQQTNQ